MTSKQPKTGVRKERYCGMCDEWFPARVGKECPKCGFDLSAPVVNLMDALGEAFEGGYEMKPIRPLSSYRPQHDEDCAIHSGSCRVCGRERRTLYGFHPDNPPGPNPEGHHFVSVNECSCGLDQVLSVSQEPRQEQIEQAKVLTDDVFFEVFSSVRPYLSAEALDRINKSYVDKTVNFRRHAEVLGAEILAVLRAVPQETEIARLKAEVDRYQHAVELWKAEAHDDVQARCKKAEASLANLRETRTTKP